MVIDGILKSKNLQDVKSDSCKLCGNKFDFRKVLITNSFGEYTISLAGHLSQCNSENKFKFCPECGMKLTKENFGGREI